MGGVERGRSVRVISVLVGLAVALAGVYVLGEMLSGYVVDDETTEPHIEANASASPGTIWVETAPASRQPKESTVTLQLVGAGVPTSTAKPLDTLLMIDSSGSMTQNDPADLRLEAAKHYVDLLASPDQAAVVDFNTNAVLVDGHHLGSDFDLIKSDIDTIGHSGFTNLFDPIRIATDELVGHGNGSHVWLEILLTDGRDTTGHTRGQILGEAQRAASRGIVIYTIGLIGDGPVDEALLEDIADATGGVYLRATSADSLDAIYRLVHRLVQGPDVAGYDNRINATLPDFITYVAGTARPTPDAVAQVGGRWILQWSLPELRVNHTWNATFNITSSLVGSALPVFASPETAVSYVRQDGRQEVTPFPETRIDVLGNGPPVADAGPPRVGMEGSSVVFDGSGSYDPDNDTLRYRWDFEDDGVWDTPWSGIPDAAYTWGDDYAGAVALEVTDGTFTANARTTVVVRDIPPTILGLEAFMLANVTLRVAGEKWHDVVLRLYDRGNETGSVRVVRYPGSPDDQSATLSNVSVSLRGGFSAVATYTPADDPVNGQPNGASPAWIIFHWENGNETRLHHTFNVQHDETWVWRVENVPSFAVGEIVHLGAIARDPGSDDLVFAWDLGDGRTLTTIAYNDGVGPDPYPSPDMNPITAVSVVSFTYPIGGTYVLVLIVTDDDGGYESLALPIRIGP